MKKILLLFCTVVLVVSLVGCKDQSMLENEYFENTENDSLEDALELYSSNGWNIADYYEETYRKPYTERALQYNDDYIRVPHSDSYYRYEFINYHLSDDRAYLSYTELWFFGDQDRYMNSFIDYDCDKISEGEVCTNEGNTKSFSFQMDGENLLINYTVINYGYTKESYEIYFYSTTESALNLEFRVYEETTRDGETYEERTYTKFVYRKYEEEYKYSNRVGSSSLGVVEYRYYDIDTMDLFTYSQWDDRQNIEVFDKETNELFDLTKNDQNDYYFGYSEFVRNTLKVQYIPLGNYFRINLSEVDGWDRIDYEDNSHKYKVYYGDLLVSEDLFVNLERFDGEYVYMDYHDNEIEVTDDILSLSRYNLDSGYSLSYFDEKQSYAESIFDDLIEQYGFDNSIENNISTFLDIIDIEID